MFLIWHIPALCIRNCVDISQEQVKQTNNDARKAKSVLWASPEWGHSCNSFEGIKIRNAVTAYIKEYFLKNNYEIKMYKRIFYLFIYHLLINIDKY